MLNTQVCTLQIRVTSTELVQRQISNYRHVTKPERLFPPLRIALSSCPPIVTRCSQRCSPLVSVRTILVNNKHGGIMRKQKKTKNQQGKHFIQYSSRCLPSVLPLANGSATFLINVLHGDSKYSITDCDLYHPMKTSGTNRSYTSELYSVPKFFHSLR